MRAFFALLLCACSAAAPSPRSQSAPVADLPISCHGGREIVYTRNLPDGTSRTLDIQCTDDSATASSWITRPVELDMDPTVGRSGPVYMGRTEFDRVWRAVISGRCDRTKPTRSSLTV